MRNCSTASPQQLTLKVYYCAVKPVATQMSSIEQVNKNGKSLFNMGLCESTRQGEGRVGGGGEGKRVRVRVGVRVKVREHVRLRVRARGKVHSKGESGVGDFRQISGYPAIRPVFQVSGYPAG